MKEHTKDNLEGKGNQVAGSVKETTGRIVGDRDLEAEGKGQKVAGKVQDKIGDVKKVFEV